MFFSPPLPVGTEAPPFTLPDSNGGNVELAQHRGLREVVLIWYPGDDTRICTQQLCAFRDAWAGLTEAAVYGVNPQNAASHERFKQKWRFPFPLLVDEGQRVGRLYRTSGWLVRRTVYRIDREGVIRFARRGNPSVAEVLGQ
jgi:thioredoxin-dependent peroxiredoxin